MEKKPISFDESCARECAIKRVQCGGPTASGLEGYICENCASSLVLMTQSNKNMNELSCSYCGNHPSIATTRGFRICLSCATKGLETVRNWYSRK